jgi:hypothetical protein
MTTLHKSTIVTRPTREPFEDDTVRPGAQAWQLGILTDRAGHVHLGAIVAGTGAEPCAYIDLLAPIGAGSASELDPKQLVVLVRGKNSPTYIGLPNAASTMRGSDGSWCSLST